VAGRGIVVVAKSDGEVWEIGMFHVDCPGEEMTKTLSKRCLSDVIVFAERC
jgi:hypothetical protein